MHWDLQKVHEVLSTLSGTHGGRQSGKNHSTLRVHLFPPLTLSSPPNYQTAAANRVHEQPCTPFQTCISSTSSQYSKKGGGDHAKFTNSIKPYNKDIHLAVHRHQQTIHRCVLNADVAIVNKNVRRTHSVQCKLTPSCLQY